VNARPVSAPTSGVKFPPPAFYALGLGAGFLAGRRWPAAVWPGHPLALRAVGILGFLLGLGFAGWGVLTFRSAGTSPNPMRPTTSLAFGGPYRFSRNPMYLGLAVASASFALFWNALWPLLSVPFAMALVWRFVIAREERYLAAKFGEEYLRYRGRVRRWI
jgi:protein-S-isoprenylcysteine O-methyltransferase Ste14